MQNEKITLDSFVLLTVIGKGSYAKVVLVRKKVYKQSSQKTDKQGSVRHEDS